MRTNTLLQLTLAVLLIVTSGCAARNRGETTTLQSASPSPAPSTSPAPLYSCEHRELQLDGVDLIADANVDSSLGSLQVVRAPDDGARARALQDAQRYFGAVKIDTRRTSTITKWGLPRITDPCGHPVNATPIPSSMP